MAKWFLIVLLLFGGYTLSAAEQGADEADHEELRALLHGLENAVNTEHYELLPQYFHKNMTVTMSNQDVLSSREDIGKFFAFWFGKDGYLKHVDMELTADAPTSFYAGKTIGIVRGSGVENTYLSDSRFFPMKTRWTATVIKGDDGQWRILALHIGVNFLENPILSMVEKSGVYFTLFGTAGGLLIGFLTGYFIRRRRSGFATSQQ